MPREAFSPSLSCTTMSQGEEALGGFFLKDGVRSSEVKFAGTVASNFFFFLNTRPEQVSSSLEEVASLPSFAYDLQGLEQKGLGQKRQESRRRHQKGQEQPCVGGPLQLVASSSRH